ncbi:MAG TPA: tyrosine-type recombinase/integrase [Verrucomicrobiae bacterium]
MNNRPKRGRKRAKDYPKKVTFGRESVTVYQRKLGGYMVSNYAEGKRRFDSYPTAEEAENAALALAKKLSERDVISASMTRQEAIDYAAAVQTLAPFNVSLPATAATVAECLKKVGSLDKLMEAVSFFTARSKKTTEKLVSAVAAELIEVKKTRGASQRYREDLKYRLTRFADSFRVNASSVTTADINEWFDREKFKPQSYANFRRVLFGFFQFAVSRGYAADNPILGVEKVKVRGGDTLIYTPEEMIRLLAAASGEFLPCIAIGGFAGLRSTEIERLEWSDIDLTARHIVIGASRSKTASRRIVPISDNLAAWLENYKDAEGKVWKGNHKEFYRAQKATARNTEVKENPETGARAVKALSWKTNALRHSYASYRFAEIGDAGRVAGELGNSAAVVHRHYRELVKKAAAEKWFGIKPEQPANIVSLPVAVNQ